MALDSLNNYVEEAKALLTNIEKASKDVYFVDTLPSIGQEEKIYITKDNNSYYWSKEAASFIELTSTNFDYLYGGNAFSQ